MHLVFQGVGDLAIATNLTRSEKKLSFAIIVDALELSMAKMNHDSGRRVTLADVAKAAGLSRAATSYALRNDPNAAPKTRARVQAIAKEIGYRPDPVLSKLMLRLHEGGIRASGSRIAFLNVGESVDYIQRTSALMDFFGSAQARANEHGYDTEEFWLHEPGRSSQRLAQILEARGIQGLLVGSTGHPNSCLEFPWDRFAAVTVGYSVMKPRLHRVVTHHYENALQAIGKMRDQGYRKLGLLVDPVLEPTMKQLHLAALLTQQQGWSATECLPVCSGVEGFTKWIQAHQPDVILNGTDLSRAQLTKFGLPESLSLVSLVADDGEAVGMGVRLGYQKLGRIAMNVLADLLLHDELGVPEDSRIVMVDGEWFDSTFEA
ncbi:LacI family DNA-binding transcriptional regulator [Coraliomargarita sp. SDUM461004]|uniref:LacI family DNA-binding transcriptional regulator n=1 Tax=Thalassobacterium sedimentorum TaxID=3041258 RepID=A0ABU1AIP4_9BACT|nr:LacI family DNA-binding transcriptional regulator [Coraliomargarita sp. SDUM461004]MDQ8194681.1 LacI family DNA-binding transcriptional regulator [Coraliomargarita sp. SDUM461004]